MNVDDGLRRLRARGFRFQALRDGCGVCAVVGSYGWPECYDRLHIWGEHEAVAARVVSGCGGTEDVLWSCTDDAATAIEALLDLPAPDQPGAPRLVRRAASGLWLPSGSGPHR